jgi:hypothetical protein
VPRPTAARTIQACAAVCVCKRLALRHQQTAQPRPSSRVRRVAPRTPAGAHLLMLPPSWMNGAAGEPPPRMSFPSLCRDTASLGCSDIRTWVRGSSAERLQQGPRGRVDASAGCCRWPRWPPASRRSSRTGRPQPAGTRPTRSPGHTATCADTRATEAQLGPARRRDSPLPPNSDHESTKGSSPSSSRAGSGTQPGAGPGSGSLRRSDGTRDARLAAGSHAVTVIPAVGEASDPSREAR